MRYWLYVLPLLIPIQPLLGQLSFHIVGTPEPLVFDDLRDFNNGVESILILEIGTGQQQNGQFWDVLLRATDDLSYQNHSIPIHNIQASVVSQLSGFNKTIFLSTQDQYLIRNATNTTNRNVIPLFLKLRALGGNDFLQPSGAYTTTLVFTLVED